VLYRGTESVGLAALIVWVAYVISSMAVTGLTWGQIIAWNEPRVQATGLILLAALVLYVVARLVANEEFTALISVLMGIVPWIVVKQAGVIRHPVDPIGGSESAAIQTGCTQSRSSLWKRAGTSRPRPTRAAPVSPR
jgi:hypothetical protein